MPNAFADIFRQAARLNREDPQREGNLVRLGPSRQVIVSGDIHGNRNNLARIVEHAKLAQHSERTLVVQEIIHGPEDVTTGRDRSVELLVRAARLKVSLPAQVCFVLGNHDIAQLTGNEITKEGRGVCKSFSAAMAHEFRDDLADVTAALEEFLSSLPLAILCPGGILISHSLPSPNRMPRVSPEILQQSAYKPEDFKRGGAAYEWTWGRGQLPEQMEALAGMLGVEFFVIGHRHSGAGYELIPNRGISIASDGERGCVLEFASDERLTSENVLEHLKRIASLSKAGSGVS